MADNKLSLAEQLQKLQLEELLEAAQSRAARKEAGRLRQSEINESIKLFEKNQALIQSACRHRKGGKGVDNIYNGSDSNYAIIKHTFASGRRCVVCIRCRKYVEEPDPPTPKMTKEQRNEWAKRRAEFEQWWALPTDNEESGTRLFLITKAEELPQEMHP